MFSKGIVRFYLWALGGKNMHLCRLTNLIVKWNLAKSLKCPTRHYSLTLVCLVLGVVATLEKPVVLIYVNCRDMWWVLMGSHGAPSGVMYAAKDGRAQWEFSEGMNSE